MTSLGFSEYAETSNNDNSRPGNGNGNGNGKIYNRRNGGGNRTLKIPRTNETERGLLQSPNGGAITGISNENGNNGGVVQQAGKKIKQIKDYIESIHRKGGEDSEEDGEDGDAYGSPSVLPSYPAQGMGVYATNVSHSGIIRGADTLSSNTPSSAQVVRKTTQMNSLNPSMSYSSTLLEGMADSAGGMMTTAPPSMYFEKLTGIAGAPKKDSQGGKSEPFSTNAYASQYYEQFVPYAESLANQLAAGGGGGGGGGSGGSMSGTNAALIEKLNYIIHMLEDKKDEKTGHVVEELVLYCFLGVFIIFIVDTFTRAASGGGAGAGRGGGGGGGFGMFGGRRSYTAGYRR